VHDQPDRDGAPLRDAVEVRDGGQERAHADARAASHALPRRGAPPAETDRRPVMTAILAAAPALPLHSAGKYVAGAYIVFLALILIYVAIMAVRAGRTERELTELRRDVAAREAEHGQQERDLEHVA